MPKSIGLMLVTYSKDLVPARKFIDSFNRFNKSNLKLYVVISREDLNSFSEFMSKNVEIVFKEDIPTRYAEDSFNGMSKGYINQEIVKLAFYKLGLLDNYLCCDSDGEFIRDFYSEDFMATPEEPFTVRVQDRELMSDPSFESMWAEREFKIRKIYDFLDISQPRLIETCHNFQVFSTATLKSMEERLLTPRKFDYIDLIRIVPYEFSWYTIYHSMISKKVYISEPFFKMFHNDSQLVADLVSGKGPSSISRGYLGVVVNGNFQHANRQLDRESELGKVLGFYVPMSVLLKSFIYKVTLFPFLIKKLLYPAVGGIVRKIRKRTQR